MSTPVKEVSLAEKVCAMRELATYPQGVRQVRALETHFAWVFLAGEFVYKLKKPVQHERMNHASLAARRHSCFAELELNRRLAPQVYLAVVPLLVGASGELSLLGDGEPVEWLVKMRRLPEEFFLDRCIREQRLELRAVQAVGWLLADFYKSRHSETMSADGYCKRLRSQVQVNQRELLSPELNLPIELVNDIAYRQERFLKIEAKLVGTRAGQGRIVEAHGDLRPEHIHLGTPECVIDCLEFDRDLRLLDPLDELAFLFMECEMLDATWVGREIVEIYGAQNDDGLSEPLLRFYCSHRAASRAKMVAWHLRDPLYRARADWQARATRYLMLARNHLDGL
jgi:aminoglycoside phosphotransferase family enzyme